jgi:acetyl/propionyl-CoA carboxylase alpha subunit
MAAAGVPIVPGVDATAMDDDAIANACAEVGYPVLIKAAAGGGGKGMRPVHEPAELSEALAAARREAAGAFGDDRLIIEKLVKRPRHVEVQVFGDTHGNVVHLFERECSIQRRHQKIVEETPSPAVDDQLRGAMGHSAVNAARAVDYVGAGTVEFILGQDGSFHFLEMNTRLQVEHPVTELVTGIDLVEWQLRVAAGETMPLSQDAIVQRGHAIEVRLYAEDPAAGFLPQVGVIRRLDVPSGDGIRVDSGIEPGSEVSRFYDPMLAKLVVHGPERAAAVRKMRVLLGGTIVHGVLTNLDHLSDVVAQPAFLAGDVDTGFLDDYLPDWEPHPATTVEIAAVATALTTPGMTVSGGPWEMLGPWRVSAAGGTPLRLEERHHVHDAAVRRQGDRLTVVVGDETHAIEPLQHESGVVHYAVDGHPVELSLTVADDEVWAHVHGRTHRFHRLPPTRHADATASSGGGQLTSPMPGAVVDVRVGAGDHVAAGQVLAVVEAMKMEHPITAPGPGVITEVRVSVGEAVDAGAALLGWESTETEEVLQ